MSTRRRCNCQLWQRIGIALISLFGIFAAASVLAACGPQAEGCIECGPRYGNWSLDWCPYVNNSPGISPASFNQCPGDAPQMPTITPPTYGVGQKERSVSYDCSPATIDYGGITFSVSAVSWDPPLPAKFSKTNCPSFTSTVYVNVTSSDTNLCPSPGRVNVGSCTWYVSCACLPSSYSTNCTDGSVVVTNFIFTPTNDVCLGTALTVSGYPTISNGVVIVTTHYTNACGKVDTNLCADTSITNTVTPTVISNWWTATGSSPASGLGSFALFTPTNCANGTVTFYAEWQHICGTNTEVASGSAPFVARGIRLNFYDRPTRLKSQAPVTWSATLEAVCVSSDNKSNYTSLASVTYGFAIATNGTVTTTAPSGSSSIIIDSFAPYSTPTQGGVTITAHYLGGCGCTNFNWVQTITTSHPLGGCTSPYNDPCPPDDDLPYYWTESEIGGYTSRCP